MTTLTIDLDALAHNLGVIRDAAPGAEVAAVVKADAYGLGAGPISRRLWSEGVRSFFVARLSEGEALRHELGERSATIYVFDGLLPGTSGRLSAARLTPVLSTAAQAHAASPNLPVALQIDTGMHRQGLPVDSARALAGELAHLNITLLMSHLGSATDPAETRNPDQLASFRTARTQFPHIRASFAASAGAFLGPDYRFDMVRAGITLYGGGPEERPDPRLRAVAILSAPILDIRDLQPGDRVGYGTMFTADRPMRIAVVGAGYADGFLRAAACRARVWCAGALRRVLTVNMDLMAVEVTDTDANLGDPVELIGPHAAIDDLAAASNTVAHEVLVRLSARADRAHSPPLR